MTQFSFIIASTTILHTKKNVSSEFVNAKCGSNKCERKTGLQFAMRKSNTIVSVPSKTDIESIFLQ